MFRHKHNQLGQLRIADHCVSVSIMLALIAVTWVGAISIFALLSWAAQGIHGGYSLSFWQHICVGAVASLLLRLVLSPYPEQSRSAVVYSSDWF